MLGKLLKHDCKSLGRSLAPVYIIVLLMTLFTKGIEWLTIAVPFLSFIKTLSLTVFLFLIVGTIFFTFFMAIKRFYKNIYRDEGYLTNTLPVKKSHVLLSKLLSNFLFMLISLIIIGVSLLVVFSSEDILLTLSTLFAQISLQLGYNQVIIIIFFILYFVIALISNLLMIMAGISLGQLSNGNKVVMSVVASIILYYAYQIINLVFFLILYLFNHDLFTQLNNVVPTSIFSTIFIGAGILMIGYIVINYIICYRSYTKRLNLD